MTFLSNCVIKGQGAKYKYGMKEKKFAIAKCIVIAVFAAVIALCGISCGGATKKYEKSISEIRDAVYEGSSENFDVTAVSGVREQPFVADGAAGDKKEFTVITVKPKEFAPNMLYGYTVTVGGAEHTGLLSMHPFGESYSVELDCRTKEPNIALNIKLGALSENIVLTSIVEDDDVSADRALDTAMNALKEELKPLKKGGGLNCEIYVRLIANPINAEGGYYWYVAFIGENTYAALIDRKSAQVIGVKN